MPTYEETTSRAEHLAWCKRRAVTYAREGAIQEAFSSMASDMGKHSETANHTAIELGMMLLLGGQLSSPSAMEEFINGFN